MNKAESVPSGIRLKQLIQSYHTEILDREKSNDRFIHLYNIGTYWVAFERSACGLCGLFPKSEFALFRVPGRLEYVVMVSVSESEVVAFARKHVVRRDELDYMVLMVSSSLVKEYYKWHADAVRSVLL